MNIKYLLIAALFVAASCQDAKVDTGIKETDANTRLQQLDKEIAKLKDERKMLDSEIRNLDAERDGLLKSRRKELEAELKKLDDADVSTSDKSVPNTTAKSENNQRRADSLKIATEEASRKAAQEAEKKEQQQAWVNEWLKQREKLWDIDCKLFTVKEVERWWQNLDSEKKTYLNTAKYKGKNLNIAKTLDIYKTFFAENNMGKFKEIADYKSLFSPEQMKYIKRGFLHSSAIFNACVNEKRILRCFRMPQKLGLMDDNFELSHGGIKVVEKWKQENKK